MPEDSLPFWQDRLGGRRETRFGEARLALEGPDGEGIALVGTTDGRAPWTGEGLPAGSAVRGLHSVTLTLRDARPMVDLLAALGYREDGREGPWTRMRIAGNGADALDLHEDRDAPPARQGAGSVHHIAFSVPDRAAQDAVRQGFVDLGLRPTPPIDRDYFQSVYVRTPGGILFELATEEPGFARDEPPEALGRVLRLPRQHAHLRPRLIRSLQPLPGLAMEDPAGGPA
ncbi:Lactoylglutathione lyase [Rubellimicrobium thermophilum DSM 16684]|uniref:Lactoylglutathione lyase n=1 Tax=Rubellimicrobium thermophilum DSM 16684 TaxID=1123069 RepID=S9S362_9RHOB|nr:Lactoylglutathione lyase [Rubellimicrobium thermophilum DSM 16684]